MQYSWCGAARGDCFTLPRTLQGSPAFVPLLSCRRSVLTYHCCIPTDVNPDPMYNFCFHAGLDIDPSYATTYNLTSAGTTNFTTLAYECLSHSDCQVRAVGLLGAPAYFLANQPCVGRSAPSCQGASATRNAPGIPNPNGGPIVATCPFHVCALSPLKPKNSKHYALRIA